MADLFNFEMLNYIILFIIAVYVLQGIYRGCLVSLGNTAGMTFSWLIASGVTPFMSAAISKTDVYTFFRYLTEVTDNVSSVELSRTAVTQLADSQISDVVAYANLPIPYSDRFLENITTTAFSGTEFDTVADYLNLTIANVTVNILSFLIIYIIARILIGLVISTMNYSHPFPVLKKYDGLIGGILGGVRGFLSIYVWTLLIPLMLVLVSLPEFSKIVTDSSLVNFFYNYNFLFGFISGGIG